MAHKLGAAAIREQAIIVLEDLLASNIVNVGDIKEPYQIILNALSAAHGQPKKRVY